MGLRRSYEDALIVAKRIGYPVVVRPELCIRRTSDGNRLFRC